MVLGTRRGNVNYRKKTFSILTLGIIFAVLAASFEAIADVMPKPLINYTVFDPFELNPIVFTFIIFLLNGLFFSIFTRKSKSLKELGLNKIVLLSFIGFLDVTSAILYYYGLSETSAINASIIGNAEIVFGILIAVIVLREKLKGQEIIPFSLIIFGAILIPLIDTLLTSDLQFNGIVYGDLLIIFASIFLAIAVTLYRYVSNKIDSKRIMQVTSFSGSGFSLLLIFLMNIPLAVEITQIPLIFSIGLLGIGISALCFVLALKYIGAVRTILIFSSTTVFAILISNVVLLEQVTLTNGLSVGLVIFGTIMLRGRLSKI